MPQPAPWPLDLGVAVGPLEPVRRELPADRPVRVVLHGEHERAADHTVFGAKLEQRPLRLLRHGHHPGLPLLVVLGPPADRLLLEVEIVPPEVQYAAESPARP